MNLKSISIALFVVLVVMGTWLSIRKPLWTDEIHTQVNTIDPLSYREILLFKYSPEGNRCPTFYLIQKAVSDSFHYQFPVPWDQRWNFHDIKSQIILRIPSNIYMSLSIVLIFYFFSRYYSVQAGLFSLAAVFVSPLVWEYWVEARHYSLWFLLTVLQYILFFRILLNQDSNRADWKNLIIVHFLLALTVIFSCAQIVVISFLLWLYRSRDIKKYAVLTIIPILIILFYFYQSKELYYWVKEESGFYPSLFESVSLFLTNLPQLWMSFPLEFLMIFIFYGIVLFVLCRNQLIKDIGAYQVFGWVALMLISGWALLFIFAKTTVMEFSVPSRYFMYLAPLGIFSTTLCFVQFAKWFKSNRWMLCNVMVVLFGCIILRALNTFMSVHALGIY